MTDMTSDDLFLFNCWQLADWEGLANIDTNNKPESYVALKASAQFQLGEAQLAKNTLTGLPGSPSEQTVRLLISGVFNSLGKARTILGDTHQAEAHYIESIETVLEKKYSPHVIKARALARIEEVEKIRHRHSPRVSMPYIDVVGPSGSGKTTLINHLVSSCGFVSTIAFAEKNQDKSGRVILDFLSNYPLFLENIQQTLKANDSTLNWFAKLIQGYMNSPKNELRLITDEGFVCRINTIFSYQNKELDKEKVFQYLDSIPEPHLLVIKEATPSVCFERIAERAIGLPGRMRLLGSRQKIKVIKNQILMLDWVKSFYKEKSTKVLVVDAEEKVEDVAMKIITLSDSVLAQD